MTHLASVRAALIVLGFAIMAGIPSASATPASEPALMATQEVYLRPDLMAHGPQITLGDLFDVSGASGSVRVAMAPAPGRRVGLDAQEVAKLARDHGLSWSNARGLRRLLVTRASQTVPLPRIRSALADAFSAQLDGETVDIQVNGRPRAFHLAPELEPSIGIDILSLDDQTGRFRARVRVPNTAPNADGQILSGQVHKLMPVPVLARTLSVGSEIRAQDWTWADRRADRLGRNTVIDPAQLEGMALRRTIRAGTVLRATDLARPVLVGRGDLVTVMVRRPGMELTATGRALREGGLGDLIQVRNTSSMRIIDARITGSGRADAVTASPAIRTASR